MASGQRGLEGIHVFLATIRLREVRTACHREPDDRSVSGEVRTLRLVQEAAGAEGVHRVEVTLEGDGAPQRAVAQVKLALEAAELDQLRWYLEDYPAYPLDPAPQIAAEVEERLAGLGEELFRAVFHASDDTRDLWATVRDHLADTRVEVVTDVAGATAIPWELLRDPTTNVPLALRARAFVRPG